MNEQFLPPHMQRASTAPASKMSGNFPTNQPRAYQQNNFLQQNGTYLYNHVHAPFQTYGNEVQRYDTPRSMNVPEHHDQLIDLVSQHNIQQLTETTRLSQQNRGLAREVDDLRSAFQNDFQTLEKRVASLQRAQVLDSAQKQTEAPNDAEIAYKYYWAKDQQEMSAVHPKEQIAESYLTEAEDREASAAVLRQKALTLCPDILGEEQTPTSRLQIEGAPIAAHDAVSSGFACCSTEFSAIGELVEHVERAHTAPEHRFLTQQRSSDAEEIKASPEQQTPSANGEKVSEITKGKQAVENIDFETRKQNMFTWTPNAVRNMPPALTEIAENAETFSFEFLRTTLAGDFWSPGFYFIPEKSILPSQSYWILDPAHEPFLPTSPGQHGAKLTAFFNETVSRAGEAPGEENYLKVPVFIKSPGKDEYSYFGDYSQLRFSDKVGYDTIAENIPEAVLRFHAEQLAETGRPKWVTKALKEHFWPKPKYEGPIPTDSAINSPATSVTNDNSLTTGLERRVLRALVEYSAELKDWEKDSTLSVNLITSENIFKAFAAADADFEPGLRLFWEYLQCANWDMGFYNMLVGFKTNAVTKLEIGSAGKKRRPSVIRKDGSTAAKMGLAPEASFKISKPKEVVAVHPSPNAKTEFVKQSEDFDAKPTTKKGGVSDGFGKKEDSIKPSFSSKTNGAAPPVGPKSDIAAAKAFNEQWNKDGEKGKAKMVPPHLRARK